MIGLSEEPVKRHVKKIQVTAGDSRTSCRCFSPVSMRRSAPCPITSSNRTESTCAVEKTPLTQWACYCWNVLSCNAVKYFRSVSPVIICYPVFILLSRFSAHHILLFTHLRPNQAVVRLFGPEGNDPCAAFQSRTE